jgi:hypothetical protein
VFYFDPATGRRFDQGTVRNAGPLPPPFDGHAMPLLAEDRFDGADAAAWKDHGTPTQRRDGRLAGGKGMVTTLEKVAARDLMVSVDAGSDAEAGVILRFHDADNYLVGLYSPLLKSIFLHDRKDGQWGEMLGKVAVPDAGPMIHLTAAACGDHAALVLTDGTKSWSTPVVKVGNTRPGKPGLWLFQIGERQEFDNFAVSATPFHPPQLVVDDKTKVIHTDEYQAPNLPSPQDWVLVMQRAGGVDDFKSGTRDDGQAMKALNGLPPRSTEYPTGRHDAYSRALTDHTLQQWLFDPKMIDD